MSKRAVHVLAHPAAALLVGAIELGRIDMILGRMGGAALGKLLRDAREQPLHRLTGEDDPMPRLGVAARGRALGLLQDTLDDRAIDGLVEESADRTAAGDRLGDIHHSTSNSSASCSVIVPPSCSTSMIVTARL